MTPHLFQAHHTLQVRTMKEKETCEYKNQWSERGGIISGHEFEEIEKTAEKQVLKCKVCGHESVGYYK